MKRRMKGGEDRDVIISLYLTRRENGGEDRYVIVSFLFDEKKEGRRRLRCELTAIQLSRGGKRGERLDHTVQQLVLMLPNNVLVEVEEC